MAADSKRKRQLRRVKRERSQLRRAVGVQQNQMQTVVKMLMGAQAELRELKPKPSVTIRTIAEPDPENFYDAPVETIGYIEPVEETHDDSSIGNPA